MTVTQSRCSPSRTARRRPGHRPPTRVGDGEVKWRPGRPYASWWRRYQPRPWTLLSRTTMPGASTARYSCAATRTCGCRMRTRCAAPAARSSRFGPNAACVRPARPHDLLRHPALGDQSSRPRLAGHGLDRGPPRADRRSLASPTAKAPRPPMGRQMHGPLTSALFGSGRRAQRMLLNTRAVPMTRALELKILPRARA